MKAKTPSVTKAKARDKRADLRAKLQLARKSATVRLQAGIAMLVTLLTGLQDQVPLLAQALTGWNLVIFIVAVGAATTYTRVRREKAAADEGGA